MGMQQHALGVVIVGEGRSKGCSLAFFRTVQTFSLLPFGQDDRSGFEFDYRGGRLGSLMGSSRLGFLLLVHPTFRFDGASGPVLHGVSRVCDDHDPGLEHGPSDGGWQW